MRTAILDRQKLPPIEAARRAFRGGDIAATERICAQVLARDGNDWAAWAVLTETALQRGRNDDAIVCAEALDRSTFGCGGALRCDART